MVKCDKCNKQITDSKDVNVVALFGIKPVTMCNNCYAARERGITRHMFYHPKWFPLNSLPWTISLIIGTLLLLVVISIILFNNSITSTANGQATEFSIGWRLLISFIISLLLAWQWTLWIIARNKVNVLRSKV